MHSVLFKLFLVFNLCVLHEVFGKDVEIANIEDNHPYNILLPFERFHRTITLKDSYPALAKYFLSNPIDRNFVPKLFESFSESSKCVKDIVYAFESLKDESNQWSLNMLDSFAKPPESGILLGNLNWVGEYNECIKVYAPAKAPGSTTGNFHGQYCSLAYNLQFFNATMPLKFAICLPDSCSPKDLQNETMNLLFKAGGYPILDEASFFENITMSCMPRERQLNTAAISVIVLLAVLCAFALLGSMITVVKYFKKLLQEKRGSALIVNIYDKEITEQEGIQNKNAELDDTSLIQSDGSSGRGFLEKCEAFLNCFCVFTNGAKLLNTDSSEGQLMCIHGIRFLSMSWVILGHAYMMGFGQTRNMREAVDVLDDFPFQVVLQGFFSVDSFFVLSGFLLSYMVMKEFSKTKGSINWLYFYIHRYIRLTPIYMIVLGFFASVYYYLGSGPYWPMTDYDPNCRKTWWWNLLYINNFIDQSDQCMAWGWYLANDMQFFVISPIFLISLWRWPKIGYSVIGLFLLACMLSSFFITYHYDLMVGLVGLDLTIKDTATVMLKFADYFNQLYVKPYTRIGPYLVGIIAGYILFKHKATNRPKLSWINLCIGWIVAAAVTLTCVYGLYRSHPSLVARSIYNAVNRICFGCGLSWVIYVCLTNQSEVINKILSYKLFVPLSRLTYTAYLIHPLILSGYFISLKQPFEFTHPSVVVLYLGLTVITYALALPVSLILESPVVSLEKMIRMKFTGKKTESAS